MSGRRRGPGRPFQKGQSGNPSGRPAVVKEIQELARSESADMLRVLIAIAKNPKNAPAARSHAAVAVIERGYGKPAQDLTVRNLDMDPDSLTDAELVAFLRQNGVGGAEPAAPSRGAKVTH